MNVLFLVNRGMCLTAAGRSRDAIDQWSEMLKLDSRFGAFHLFLAIDHALHGDLQRALAEAEQAYSFAPFYPQATSVLVGLLEAKGDSQRAAELLGRLHPGTAFGAPRGLAYYYALRGVVDATAEWVGKAIDQHDAGALVVLRTWIGDRLRPTPHWARLMRKLNLPED